MNVTGYASRGNNDSNNDHVSCSSCKAWHADYELRCAVLVAVALEAAVANQAVLIRWSS